MLNTHTDQPQPDQNRADHGLATNPTDPSDLSASSGSSELTQVECCNISASFFFAVFYSLMVATEMELVEITFSA